jgi:hypothetical protein
MNNNLDLTIQLKIDKRLKGSSVKKIGENVYAISLEGYKAVLQRTEPTSIPCYVDCDINHDPKACHERLDKQKKCNLFEDKIYHHCGEEKNDKNS